MDVYFFDDSSVGSDSYVLVHVYPASIAWPHATLLEDGQDVFSFRCSDDHQATIASRIRLA